MPRPTFRGFLISFALCVLLCTFAASGLLSGVPFLKALIELALFALAVYVGRRVFLRALLEIQRRRIGEVFFAAAVVLFGAVFSLYEMFMMIFTERGAERLFFAPCAGIIAVSLFCEYIREKTKSSDRALELLEALRPDTAAVLRDGAERHVSADEISEGDIVAIKPGETVPCDGDIIAGLSDIDEKLLTGALLPVLKGEGEQVMAGSINLSGFLTVRSSGESGIEALISTYREAPRAEQKCLAQRVTRIAGAVVLAVSCIAMILFALFGKFDTGILLLAAIAAVFCPCGLMLSRAAAELAASKKGASEGLNIRDISALENIGRADTVVIDRTGTATVGKLSVSDVIALSDLEETSVIRLAAALCAEFSDADHFAIVEHCRLLDTAIPPCISLSRLPGKLSGIVDGKRITLSSIWEDIAPFISDYPELTAGDKVLRAVFAAEEAVGIIALCDKLKPNAIAAVKAFSERGIEAILISGEDDPSVKEEAAELGALDFKTGLKAEQKSELIQKLKAEGKTVAVIADGVCDCAALRAADFSFALNSGAEEAKETASAVLLRNDLRDVIAAIELARSTDKSERLSVFATAALRVTAFAASTALYAFAGAHFGVLALVAGILMTAVLPYIFAIGIKAGGKK